MIKQTKEKIQARIEKFENEKKETLKNEIEYGSKGIEISLSLPLFSALYFYVKDRREKDN